MVQILPMSTSLREEMLRYVPRTDDPEIRARQKHVARVLLDMDTELREEVGSKAHEDGLKQGLEKGVDQGGFWRRVPCSVGCWRGGSCQCRRRTRRVSKHAPISRRWSAGSTRRSLPRALPKHCTDRRHRNRARSRGSSRIPFPLVVVAWSCLVRLPRWRGATTLWPPSRGLLQPISARRRRVVLSCPASPLVRGHSVMAAIAGPLAAHFRSSSSPGLVLSGFPLGAGHHVMAAIAALPDASAHPAARRRRAPRAAAALRTAPPRPRRAPGSTADP